MERLHVVIMHFSPFLLLLPALATAQEQIPLGERLQGWFNKAKSYVPAPPVVAEKAAEKVAEKAVTPFNITNWQANLEPSTESAQDWLIFVTGGNKTCFGRCERAEKAFNVCSRDLDRFESSQLADNVMIGIRASVCCRPDLSPARLPEL